VTYGCTTRVLALAGVCLLAAGGVLRQRQPAVNGAAGLATASPGVRFVSVALGGFRGLLADVLWVRASDLQDDGRFYELVQLADWITQLEPRHAEVWAYHAWNMAYNVSVMFPDHRDRWRWVNHGLRLLRDQGLAANPRDDQLYWELGWLYADKIGGTQDEAQDYYRVALAVDMSRLFPEGTADYARLAATEAAAGLAVLRLRPEVMQSIDRIYGPLDWRLPSTHALYWGYAGRGMSEGRSAWCTRLVYQGLLETVRGGGLCFDPARRLYVRGPRLDIAARAVRIAERDPDALTHPISSAQVANVLRESMILLHAFGRDPEALAAMQSLGRLQGVVPATGVVAGVRRELAERVGGVGDAAQERIVASLLTRSRVWLALGDRGVADGFERLARLYWETLQQVATPTASVRRPGSWERLEAEAGRAARDEVPDAARPDTQVQNARPG
jgi:hypothetical protein